MSASLEDMIRDLALRGELSHLSIAPRGNGWSVSFCPTSKFGVFFGEHKDPVEAIKAALEAPRLRRRKSSEPTTTNAATESPALAVDESPEISVDDLLGT
jgi:hypothetical protein